MQPGRRRLQPCRQLRTMLCSWMTGRLGSNRGKRQRQQLQKFQQRPARKSEQHEPVPLNSICEQSHCLSSV